MTAPDRPWTIRDAAAFLTLDAETVRRMARDGRLPGKKLGRDWRFDPEAVRALIEPTKPTGEVGRDLLAHVMAARERARLRARTG